MAKARIDPGICGFITNVTAHVVEDHQIQIRIESDCPHIQKLAERLKFVDVWEEVTYEGEIPTILLKGQEYCAHPACPVPAAIIKTLEVEAGLALPKDVVIHIEK
ncbi:MAG: hypothetical protein R6U57_11240 [Anaerolineales bacterium]